MRAGAYRHIRASRLAARPPRPAPCRCRDWPLSPERFCLRFSFASSYLRARTTRAKLRLRNLWLHIVSAKRNFELRYALGADDSGADREGDPHRGPDPRRMAHG